MARDSRQRWGETELEFGLEPASRPASKTPVSGRLTGTVDRTFPAQGYLFIAEDDGGNLFAPVSYCESAIISLGRSPVAGDRVSYRRVPDVHHEGKFLAKHVCALVEPS